MSLPNLPSTLSPASGHLALTSDTHAPSGRRNQGAYLSAHLRLVASMLQPPCILALTISMRGMLGQRNVAYCHLRRAFSIRLCFGLARADRQNQDQVHE